MIEIYGKDACTFCSKATGLAETLGLNYVYKKLGKDFSREELFEMFPNARTFPQIRADGEYIGGYEQFVQYVKKAA
jgi:glutaredoxin 3